MRALFSTAAAIAHGPGAKLAAGFPSRKTGYTMNRTLPIVAAAAGAALASYFFDAQQGRRRRALARDKIYGRLSHLDDAGRVVAVDLRNRAQGLAAGLRQQLARGEVPDEVLAERVRARLGRAVSHPGSVEVSVTQGAVTLQGPVLKHELKRALRAVQGVRGVKSLDNRLEPHEQRGNISALQGGVPRDMQPDIAQMSWAPATRVLVGAGAGALVFYGLARRTPASSLLAALGLALFARAATNMDVARLAGWRGRRGIDFTKTIHIEAPVADVFAFWSNFENFPKFMRNVRAVTRNRDDSWHWEVAGPLGATVQWDARVTRSIPNELIAWATVPGGSVQHAGIARFETEGTGTRVHIRMSYNPVAGALGHVVASLFGADPLTEMDEDLMRMKSFFETGKAARDAAAAPH